MSNSTGSQFISLTEVEAVLQRDIRPANENRILPIFTFDDFRTSESVGNCYTIYTPKERKDLQVSKCNEFKRLIEDPHGHFARIDESLSALFKCNFVLKGSETVSTLSEEAYKILIRLPSRPLTLLNLPTDIDLAYSTTSSTASNERGHCYSLWDNLQVASFLGTSVICMALLLLKEPLSTASVGFRDITNSVAELLAICSTLETQTTNKVDKQSWFIVRAFLWSFWQRAIMMYLYTNMALHFKTGFDANKNQKFFLQDTFPSPALSTQDMSPQVSRQGISKNICSWAFELLRTQPNCIGMDFRLFHKRYSQLHGHLGARCNIGSTEPCDGTHSDRCQRFKGMKIVDQSAHDALCQGDCQKLRWDESSYRSISGARAVSFVETKNCEELLRYCKASEKTIAISHVWCHGQGGRPEEGVNRCLHQRYERIAQSMGCDSYWMDTPCIPEDHQLRHEAIREINSVFDSCHATLICDRDTMQIDATDLTVELMEAIIATILVCDWNVRAWTFLEAMRGRRHLQILCKDDKAVSFSEILLTVFKKGRIDLVTLCLTSPHLLPWSDAQLPKKTPIQDRDRDREKISLEQTGELLAYRPASRSGDEVVIWSLITGSDEPCYTAEALWRSSIGRIIETGFLVSSAPRLHVRGLGWAPATPYAAVASASSHRQASTRTVIYRPTHGGTQYARIEEKGLAGEWLGYGFSGKRLNTNIGIYKSKLLGSAAGELTELDKIRRQYLQHHRSGILLQPLMQDFLPQSTYNRNEGFQGRVTGTLLAVCGFNDVQWFRKGVRYHWKGVYEWPRDVPIPTFEEVNILIV